jgi:DNA helicase-2/ATP-dependent DNA helicase PcrA
MMDNLFSQELNKNQYEAVINTEGPLLILAGAGSGKTKTLTYRIFYLLATKKAKTDQILAVTFTNKAANEMRERIAKLLNLNSANYNFMPYMGTFHGISVKILRTDGDYLKMSKNFLIFDEADQLSLLKKIYKKLLINEKSFPLRQVAYYISSAKSELITPNKYKDQYLDNPVQKMVADIYPIYSKELKNLNALDFDDLILKTVQLFRKYPKVLAKWQDKFKYILVDEYQDTNNAQYQLIKLLSSKNQNIAVVGDDWQSIYSWRGADYRNILNFEKDYQNVKVVKLEQNYRSTANILNAAYMVISKNNQRSDKKIWTKSDPGLEVQLTQVSNERKEAQNIVSIIQSKINTLKYNYKDFAVLYRTNAQSRVIEELFVRYNIPYQIIGGVRFYDRKEIKDLIAYLRLIYQPNDLVSFLRIVNLPARGIGPRSIALFNQFLEENGNLQKALSRVQECNQLTPKAKKGFNEIHNLISELKEISHNASLVGLIDALIRKLNYLSYLDDGTIQSESRQENVKELLSVANEYLDLGLDGFLEEVALISDLDKADFKKDSVTLMTVHSAKGLEFPIVLMPGLEEGIFPHTKALYDSNQMEEERRLMYVGMTRAMKELYLFYANTRLLYGGLNHNPPSRFLSDIDGEFRIEPDNLENEEIKDDLFNQNEPHYIPDLEKGDQVRHTLFGEGTVVEIDQSNVVVYFKQRGIKKLNLDYTNIQKL